MTERERLIEELIRVISSDGGKGFYGDLADFIIEDRRRIVEPLVKLDLKPGTAIECSMKNLGNILEAVMQTLKLAGVDNDPKNLA